MQLVLIRHGEAAHPPEVTDSKRPLTERGHTQAEETGKYLKDLIKPEVLVVSPLLRAQETLVHIQKNFPDVPVLVCDKIKPDDQAKDAIDWLAQLPYQSSTVVCHMNVIAHIAEQLIHEPFHPFALAEARIYELPVIANGLAVQQQNFIPVH